MNTLNTHRNHGEQTPETINAISTRTAESLLQSLKSSEHPEVRTLAERASTSIHILTSDGVTLPESVTQELWKLEQRITLPQSTIQDILSSQ